MNYGLPYKGSKNAIAMDIANAIPKCGVILDACCGAFLHAACVSNRFGTDIDERCVAMSYIQCSLLGIPAIITHGNALTLECWSEWETPAYIMGYTHFASRMRKINKDTNDEKTKVENEGVCDTLPLQQRIEKEPPAKADGRGKNDVPAGTIPNMDESGQYSLF